MSDFLFGILVCVISCLLVNVGSNTLQLQKRKRKLGEKETSCASCFGWISLATGTLTYSVGLAFTPLSIVACLGSLHFLYNLIWHSTFYEFKLSLKNIAGGCFLIIGIVVMIIYSPARSAHAQHSSTQLFHLYSTEPYKIYLSFICIAYIVLGGLAKLISNGCLACLNYPLINAFLFSVQSSMLGTQSIVLGKTISGLLRLYVNGQINIFHPFNLIFLCIACLFCLISTLFWLWRCNVSEQIFEPKFINPLNESLWIIFTVVSGGVYFQEFGETDVKGICTFIYALIFILAGTALGHSNFTRDKNLELELENRNFQKERVKQTYQKVASMEALNEYEGIHLKIIRTQE